MNSGAPLLPRGATTTKGEVIRVRTVLTSSSCPKVCTHEGASCRLSRRRVALRTGSWLELGSSLNAFDEILFPLLAAPPPEGFVVAVALDAVDAEKLEAAGS